MATLKDNDLIEVGYSYETYPKCGTTSVIHIFHKETDEMAKRPYVGLRNDGKIIKFDKFGRDEFFECGGYWNELLLSTKTKSKVKLINV